MNLLILSIIAVLCWATNGNAAQPSTMAHLDLKRMEQVFLTFANNLQPVFNQTYYNVHNTLEELSTMQGVQPVLILETIYSQFLPVYAIGKEQINKQIMGILAALKHTSPDRTNISFTTAEFGMFYQAQQWFLYGDETSVTGLLDQVNALGTLTNSDYFTYTNETFTVPTADLVEFVKSFNGFLFGNEALVTALKMCLSLNVKSFLAQQNNPNSVIFLEALFNYWTDYFRVFNDIVSTINTSITGLNSLIVTSAETSTISIKAALKNMVGSANKLAQSYHQMSSIEENFANEIVNNSSKV